MSAKDVRFSVEVRTKLPRGIDILAAAVKVTLGPRGRNVVLDKGFGAPRITKDGSPSPGRLSSRTNWRTWGADGARGGVEGLLNHFSSRVRRRS